VNHCAPTGEEEYLSVTEPQRLALHKAARATLGDEEGDTLMALTPPSNTDIATLQALSVVHSQLAVEIERATSRTLRWSVGAMIVLHGGTVGLLTLTLG
jgi:hypothetical protein